MRKLWIAVLGLAAVMSLGSAGGAHGQRRADLEARFDRAAPEIQLSPVAREAARVTPSPSEALMTQPERFRRPSARKATVLGALAGAVLGAAVLYATDWDNCTDVGSMCALNIPLYAGGGAILGGVVGYAIGKGSD